MNDIHFRRLYTCAWLKDFYHEHPEVQRVKFLTEFIQTKADRTYDYSYEIVRKHYFDFIDECLYRYDAYEIELDFHREMYVFAQEATLKGAKS